MCPDKQLLSVYYDDELSSPWKEKMETHLASCPDCRTVVSVYGKLSSLLNLPVSQEIPSFAVARMRENLRTAEDRFSPVRRIFTRRVAVPLPFAVAAAAALVFAVAALLTQARNIRQFPEAVAESINLEPEEIRQVTSIDDALRFIENDEFFTGPQSSYMTMRLPKNKTFNNFGQPQIQNVSGNSSRGSGRR
jgi:hypothetical protein